MAEITPSRIRKIRKALSMSQHDFARVLWVTYSTLSRWELGYAVPFGLHLRILLQLEKQLGSAEFKRILEIPAQMILSSCSIAFSSLCTRTANHQTLKIAVERRLASVR